MDIRNPFALCNNRIVVIEDIPKEKNGLKCGCICPNCKEPFVAKMGDINCHHFAHSGQGCDQMNAYMAGLYMLLNEHVSNGRTLYLPPVIVSFELSPYSYITENNVENKTQLLSEFEDSDYEVLAHDGIEKAKFDSSEIVYSSGKKPEALIVTKNGRSMAIRITPPDTVCKRGVATKYKDMSTLEVNLSRLEALFLKNKKDEIFSFLENEKSIYKWIENNLKVKAYPRILKRSKAYYDKAQENKKKEYEKLIARANTSKIIERRNQAEAGVYNYTPTSSNTNEHKMSNSDDDTSRNIGYNDVKDKFTQQTEQIRDRFGKRWVKCKICGEIKRDTEFSMYGGAEVNLGECRDCAQQKRV